MNTWVALLRAIGGKYTLPSQTFIEILESLNAVNARTYIATGNAVFRSRASKRELLAKKISERIDTERGFAPKTLLLTPEELEAAVKNNPFRKAESAPTTLHLYFIPEVPPVPDLDRLARHATNGEEFVLREKVLYLHTPNGMARTKVAPQIEKSLGSWCTARNWRTSNKLIELIGAVESGD